MTAFNSIQRKRGDTQRIIFTIQSGSGAVDLSQWTSFVLTVSSEKEPTGPGYEVEVMLGKLSTDGKDGRVYFVPSATTPPGNYYYDAQALDSNLEKITFVEGGYRVTQDISKN